MLHCKASEHTCIVMRMQRLLCIPLAQLCVQVVWLTTLYSLRTKFICSSLLIAGSRLEVDIGSTTGNQATSSYSQASSASSSGYDSCYSLPESPNSPAKTTTERFSYDSFSIKLQVSEIVMIVHH